MGESKAATAEDARDWQMMLDVYECRVNDLSILTSIGQGLITAITLSAALGAPLLIIGTEKSVANAFFGAGLLVYLALLAASLKASVHGPLLAHGRGSSNRQGW